MGDRKQRYIAWDSCVLIDALEKDTGPKKDTRYKFVRPILEAAQNGEYKIVLSTMAIAETWKAHGIEPDEYSSVLSAYVTQEFFELVATDLQLGLKCGEIQRDHGNMDKEDVYHVATAIRWKAEALLTTDGTSKKNKTSLLKQDGKIGTPPLTIVTPEDWLKKEKKAKKASTSGS